MSHRSRLHRFSAVAPLCLAALVSLALPGQAVALTAAKAPAKIAADSAAPPGNDSIAAVVNGDVISHGDVLNRERLLALSSGLPVTQDVLDRLTPQVTRALIDERLELQEEQKRHVVVSDEDIAAAIKEIEVRNGMQPGSLRQKLMSQGVAVRTLIDQIRVQIGWVRVLRDVLGSKTQITPADIADRTALIAAATGQKQYRVGEIFIPIDQPSHAADAQHFADTVISQLRAGAPFAIIAAQFSQSQTALEGGDLGWVTTRQLDPAVASVVTQMPDGAISNPIPVPGGISIVSVHGNRQLGNQMETVVNLRQAFLPFDTQLNPTAPTAQQRSQLEKAKSLGQSVTSCAQMEVANTTAGNKRNSNPGELPLEGVANPALHKLLAELPVGKASQPLVANDGIAVVIICARDQKNVGLLSKDQVREQLLNERVDRASRQLLGELQRRAIIERRSGV